MYTKRKTQAHKANHKRKLTPRLTRQLENIYSHSFKSIRKKPYQAASVLLSLGVLSSLYFWYRAIR